MKFLNIRECFKDFDILIRSTFSFYLDIINNHFIYLIQNVRKIINFFKYKTDFDIFSLFSSALPS